MTTTAPPEKPDLAPASMASHYRKLRVDGLDHGSAVDRCLHTYFNNNPRNRPTVESAVAQVRAELEEPAEEPAAALEPEAESVSDDPITRHVAEVEQEIAELEASRGELALKALSDKSVEPQLAKLRSQLTAAKERRYELELARGERDALEEAAQATAEERKREAAHECARVVQAKKDQAARKCDKALQAFATGLAELLSAHHEQREHLEAAGLKDRIAHLGNGPVDAAINHALVAAGLDRVTSLHMPGAAPLTEGISKPVEAAK